MTARRIKLPARCGHVQNIHKDMFSVCSSSTSYMSNQVTIGEGMIQYSGMLRRTWDGSGVVSSCISHLKPKAVLSTLQPESNLLLQIPSSKIPQTSMWVTGLLMVPSTWAPLDSVQCLPGQQMASYFQACQSKVKIQAQYCPLDGASSTLD